MGDYNPLQCIMANSTCYKESKPMGVKGICFCTTVVGHSRLRRFVQPSDDDPNYEQLIHIIGKNQCDDDYNHTNKQEGYTFWIGRFEHDSVGSVQTLPLNYRGWGCGQGHVGSGNDGWIQVMILHHNDSCDMEYDYESYTHGIYNSMIALSAYICKEFNIYPLGTNKCCGISVPVITTKTEMYNLNLAYKPNFSDWFLQDSELDKLRKEVWCHL